MSDDPPKFQAGYYKFHPKAAPTGYYLSTGLPGCTCPPRDAPAVEVPITADKNGEVWQAVGGNDKFTLLGKPIPDQYKWVVRDNVLFASLRDTAVFKIDSAGLDFGVQAWHTGLPDQNVLLTYNKEANPPQLTFEKAQGSDAQLFYIIESPALKRRH